MTGETNNVLEFSLGDGRYCIDITHVDEILDASEDVTPVPNSDRQVVGVVDLAATIAVDLDRLDFTGGKAHRVRALELDPVRGRGRLSIWR